MMKIIMLLCFLGVLYGAVLPGNHRKSALKQTNTNRLRIHHTKNKDLQLMDLWTRTSDLDEAATYNPEEMNSYHLFTRENPTLSQPILVDNEIWLETTNYNASKRTVILIHGWLDTVSSDFVTVLVQAILEAEDVNVIAVDWSPGSGTINYPVAVLNTPISALAVAKFIGWLNNVSGSRLEDYHIIGHGLGAHLAGIIGRTLGGWVGYITALDPAFPGWVTNEERFKPTDGMYTEAIHTNAGLLGYLTPVADADFYPNGGIDMPGCYSQECDHNRAYYYFAESLKSGGFVGNRCYTYGSAMSGHCFLAGKLKMGGIHSKPGQSGIFFLRTNAGPPFART